MNVTISSLLTIYSERFTRPNDTDYIHYYEAFEVTVPVDGDYIIKSDSSIDTIGLLYTENFYSSLITLNLFTSDDDSGGNEQFQMNIYLKSNKRYILVVTTSGSSITGRYTLLVSGLNRANILQINNTSTLPPTTAPSPSKLAIYLVTNN